MSLRISKVNELLKREIITCVERNFEFSNVLVTIHGVDTSPNLKTAKVFVGANDDRCFAHLFCLDSRGHGGAGAPIDHDIVDSVVTANASNASERKQAIPGRTTIAGRPPRFMGGLSLGS